MKKHSGFTLLELLIAISLLAIVMTVVYSVYNSYQKTEQAVMESREVFGQGRIILDRISQDITAAWMPITTNPEGSIDYGFRGDNETISFITSAGMSARQTTGWELVEVGYRVEEVPGEKRKILFRRQDETLDGSLESDGYEIILTKDLLEFEIGYIDAQGEPTSSWEAVNLAGLPKAVTIKLVLAVNEEQTEAFQAVASPVLTWPLVKKMVIPSVLRGLI